MDLYSIIFSSVLWREGHGRCCSSAMAICQLSLHGLKERVGNDLYDMADRSGERMFEEEEKSFYDNLIAKVEQMFKFLLLLMT